MVVSTLGERGSIAFDGERFHECGIAEAEEVANTVGAGDSYIAGFTHGLILGGKRSWHYRGTRGEASRKFARATNAF